MMKNLSVATAALLSTAACVESEPAPAAAEPHGADLSCRGDTPIDAPAEIVLHGALVHATSDVGFPTAVRGASVRALDGDVEVGAAVSDDDGGVELRLATGGRAMPVHFEIEGDELPTARLYSNIPLAGAPDYWFGFATHAERLDRIADALDAPRDPSLGTVEIALGDCAYQGLPGAIVSLSGRDDDAPWAVLEPDASWTIGDVAGVTAGRRGASVMAAVNVRPGPATVTVTHDGETFPVAEIDVAAGSWTFVELRPGPTAAQ